ncbi:expansin EXLX1 family cellulose-binding protein [Vibrio tritonius]|uniref:expansin EXLX1 family cellulose-binding protein n=1 Tax=Vibrio tritonius TaxID=1435069 RepID=UPI00315D93A4
MMKSSMLCSAIALALLSAGASAAETTHTGKGTFYGYGGGGNCSFPVPDSSIYTAAMNKTDYNNSQACGGFAQVTNTDTNQTVIVRIDDQCPECAKGSIDLDQKAFAQIAAIETGIIPISWHYIADPNDKNMKLYFKEGSSQWWTGIQVRDHKYPITKLEYRISGSGESFTEVTRQPYNYFVKNDGFGVGPYDFRITDSKGQKLTVSSVALTLNSEIDTAMQFPNADE